MRTIAVALVLSAGIVASLALDQMQGSALWLAPASVFVGVVAACASTGGITWLSVVFGALGTLCFGWLTGWNASIAVIVLTASWLVPRGFMTRTERDLWLFGACAVPSAIVAGLVAAHFAKAPFVQHMAACIFAGAALAVSHVVVRVDAPVAHALRAAGKALDNDVGEALVRLADAHPSILERPDVQRGPRSKCKALLRDADSRVALRSSSNAEAEKRRKDLDESIIKQVDFLYPMTPPHQGEQPSTPDEEQSEPSAVHCAEPTEDATPAKTAEGTPTEQALVP